MSKMNREEKRIINSYDKGEWKPAKKPILQVRKYKAYAKETLKKDKRVNIRISSQDLEGIQKIAVEEGLPYQTFIASILHKYVSGRLREQRPYV